jgi:hypothetical protein
MADTDADLLVAAGTPVCLAGFVGLHPPDLDIVVGVVHRGSNAHRSNAATTTKPAARKA